VIEKKRRDRINNSLTELKRLVPSAFEKQGSAKLEKAEILQLTVDHLKSLQSKGIFFLFILICLTTKNMFSLSRFYGWDVYK
jgi:hypothetical protein